MFQRWHIRDPFSCKVSVNCRGLFESLSETIRHSAFQVASIITTSGFATTDFDLWPSFSKSIIVFLMIIGACAGSTGGGFKCGRLVIYAGHRFCSDYLVYGGMLKF